MSKDPASRREERIKELLVWARLTRLDPSAVSAFDRLERQARLSYLVTHLTARDYAKVVLQLLRSESRILIASEQTGTPP
jgi:tRNA isopentenyl-2-thiomethyl-A-37 hydroxylase MiaE